MSKDIWHKADEAPRYRFQCIYYHRDSKEYYFGEYDATFRVFLGKKTFGQSEVWKFAFAEDIIACLDELVRTRKALELARHALQELKDVIACPPDISYETGVSMYADGALQEITALEQKD